MKTREKTIERFGILIFPRKKVILNHLEEIFLFHFNSIQTRTTLKKKKITLFLFLKKKFPPLFSIIRNLINPTYLNTRNKRRNNNTKELYLVNEMSYVFDIIIKKLLWIKFRVWELFVCQGKRKKGGCNRQLPSFHSTKNSSPFTVSNEFILKPTISKLISFDFSTLHSPRIPSFCYSSHRFDRKTVVKTSSEKFLVGSTQKIILPARNILTLLCLFRQLEGTKVSWEAVTFNLPPGLNTSRRVPEKKKRFTKTLRKDYITIFKEIFVVNFPCSSYFPRSTWGLRERDIQPVLFFIKKSCQIELFRLNQSIETLHFYKVNKKYSRLSRDS